MLTKNSLEVIYYVPLLIISILFLKFYKLIIFLIFYSCSFDDSSSCLKKFLILTVFSLYSSILNLKSLLLSVLTAVHIIITYLKEQDLSILSISPLALSLLFLSFPITDIFVMTVLPISLKTFLFSSTIERLLFLMFSPLFLN